MAITHTPSSGKDLSYVDPYNLAGQRTRHTDADSSYWVNEYDKLGQVVSGGRYWSDGTPVAGQQYAYAYGDIGNRTGP